MIYAETDHGWSDQGVEITITLNPASDGVQVTVKCDPKYKLKLVDHGLNKRIVQNLKFSLD